MGRLGLGTGAGLKSFSLLPGIDALSDAAALAYVDRAEAFILNGYGPFNTTQDGYTADMTIAVYKVAEIFFVRSTAAVISAMSGIFQSEKIGTYSYQKGKTTVSSLDPVAMDPEIYQTITMYQTDDMYMNTTRVFPELSPDSVDGIRDYKDITDTEFTRARREGIVSNTVAADELL